MEDAGLSSSIGQSNNISTNLSTQGNVGVTNTQSSQPQSTSIFSNSNSKIGNADVNQSNSNSQGTGGLGTIFFGGNVTSAGFDNTSIFSGINKGHYYALYSNKDMNFDVPKLTQESIANQKPAAGQKRTNPKPYNIDMTPRENPYEAFRNPDMQERTIAQTIGNTFGKIFGSNKAK